jgi:type IV pilus assembly protein PilM
MSFWEDRFVNRPHAGAVPPSSYPDSSYVPPQASAQESAYGSYPELPSPDAEQGWASETTEPVDEIVQPVELVDESSEAASDEPAEEAEAEVEADEEPEADVEPDAEPVVEYRRRGLFRRREAVVADAVIEDEAEVEAQDEPQGDPQHEPDADESYESDASETDATETDATEMWSVVVEPAPDYAEETVEPAEETLEPVAEVAEEKRGFFRRRKQAPVEDAVEADDDQEAPEVESEPEYQPWHIAIAEEDHDADESDELAASSETDEAPFEEPKKRGLFRRRKSVPVEEPVAEDENAPSVEDDSFESTPYWGSEVTDEAEEPAEDAATEAEPQFEEPETFVYGEDESAADESAPEAEPADEPAHEAAADGDAAQEAEEAVFASEPDAEPSFAEAEVFATEDEQAPAFEDVEPYEPESATDEPSQDDAVESFGAEESDSADEQEPVPALEEWHGVSDSQEDYEIDSSQDEVAHEPIPLKKRNGGGSRGGRKVVGLKVGASQIAAAVVSGSGDSQALVDVARRPLEQGVVVGGELRDPEALVRALKAFFKESRLPTKNVRLGLSSSRVGVRTFDIAGVEDEARFDNAVRFKAHEVLPVAAHESVLDYRVVEERYTESGEVSRRVLLVVAPRDQVEPYIEACREAGLRLAGVDLESFGLLRAFVPPFGSRSRTEDSATVVVAVGHEASTLLVAGGGICEFTRVFDWGGGALQTAIADELEVPAMEAATILTHLSLTGPGRHLDSLDADTRSRALEAVRARLTPFARELVSSLQFYQTQPESLGIREILITGGTAHLEGLADALHQMIGVNVSVGDPLARVDVQVEIPASLDATIGSLAVPIGLAIEDEAGRSVNLLPKESRQARKRPDLVKVAAPLAAAIPLAALAFMFMQASGAAGDQQAELDAVRAQINALPEPTRASIDPSLAGEQASRATAVAQILGGRLTWEKVLGDVSRVLPGGVSLTELTATTPQPTTPEVASTTTDSSGTPTPPPAPAAVPTTPTGVTVTGYALDYATIARTLARLQAVPSLTNAELQSATPKLIGKKRIIEFTIVASLATPGGVQ